MRITFFILFTILTYPKLVINEFQAAPDGDEPEWIELYNDSQYYYTVEKMLIADSKTAKQIAKIEIAAYSYLILTPNFDEFTKKYNVPSEQIITFDFPTLNNTNDQIKILTKDSTVLDSLYYSFDWGEKGKSFERIDPELEASRENLAICKDPSGGTPGRKNSNREILRDLALDYVIKLDTTLVFKIKNLGKLDINNFDVDYVVDFDRDNRFESNEFLISEYQKGIKTLDSIMLDYNINEILKEKEIDIFGSFNSIAFVSAYKDEDHFNDTIHYELILPTRPGAVLINEIMYDVDDEYVEFIEIFNNSNFDINLKGWKVYDKAEWDKNNGISISNNQMIAPGSYSLICWDEEIIDVYPDLEYDKNVIFLDKNISLNKTSDLIVLKDAENIVVDSMTYYNDWHDESLLQTKNISLEKVKFNLESHIENNWTSSTSDQGATPLSENSFNNQVGDYYGVNITPNPFSPQNHTYGKACDITYTLPYQSSTVNLFIYDQNGNKITKLMETKYSGSSGVYEWNGSDHNGKLLKSGVYILYIEAKDRKSGETYSDKLLVVIGNN